jgi:hypothetical protein
VVPRWSELLPLSSILDFIQISKHLQKFLLVQHRVYGFDLDNADGQRKQLRIIHRKHPQPALFAQYVLPLDSLDLQLCLVDLCTHSVASLHLQGENHRGRHQVTNIEDFLAVLR